MKFEEQKFIAVLSLSIYVSIETNRFDQLLGVRGSTSHTFTKH